MIAERNLSRLDDNLEDLIPMTIDEMEEEIPESIAQMLCPMCKMLMTKALYSEPKLCECGQYTWR